MRYVIACLLLSAATVPAGAAQAVELRHGDRICLVGNTFAERFQLFGYFESKLLATLPDLELSVRNLAWSADETALRPRPLAFGPVARHLEAQGADVVLMFYGANESFRGADGLSAFRNDLDRLLRHVSGQSYGEEPVRVALVSPTPQQTLPDADGPDKAATAARNADLRAYADAAAEVAAEHGAAFLDIFEPVSRAFADSAAPLTINGLHLNERGYWHAATALVGALVGAPAGSPSSPAGMIEVSAGGASNLEFEPPVVVPPPPGVEAGPLKLAVADLDAGFYELRRGAETLAAADRTEWAAGVALPAEATAALTDAGERLRQTVLQGSRLFFDRYRAVNGYYIYGGRKEPFGVHSFPPEMERFDARVSELDAEAGDLSRSGKTWRLLRVDR